ncbi:MAG: hypothetical protein ACPH56_03660 [Spongiibacter marinus]|uniref:hypothetical protein n=1 Tax=Spongiibacter marinus TaxID=354246 RepID=UPI003C62726A
MELKEFISEALTQIVEGIEDSQSKVSESNAEISPTYSNRQQEMLEKNKILFSSKGGVIQHVDFDVAVTASEGKGTKAGVGVIAGAFNLGASGSSDQSNQTASRIKFSVPITLPTK